MERVGTSDNVPLLQHKTRLPPIRFVLVVLLHRANPLDVWRQGSSGREGYAMIALGPHAGAGGESTPLIRFDTGRFQSRPSGRDNPIGRPGVSADDSGAAARTSHATGLWRCERHLLSGVWCGSSVAETWVAGSIPARTTASVQFRCTPKRSLRLRCVERGCTLAVLLLTN